MHYLRKATKQKPISLGNFTVKIKVTINKKGLDEKHLSL